MNFWRFSRYRYIFALALIQAWSSAFATGAESVATARPALKVAAQASKLIEKANREGPQRIIVGLDSDFVPEGKLKAAARAAQRSAISNSQSALMSGLDSQNVVEHPRFQFIPFMVLRADAHALERLATLSMVTSLEEDRLERPSMASSNEVIGSPVAWDLGFDGTDWTVAVLDTGVDKTHPFFATQSKVVSEACYSTTDSQEESTTVCPDGREVSTATGSGVNCPAEVDDCDHGTHVAGSVAGNDQAGPNFGVARGAGIIAIQVFTSVDREISCGGSGNTPCALSFVSDQVAALERVYSLRNDFNIAAVNMSLGSSSSYTDETECDLEQSSRKAAIDNLLSAGIATVVASGNSDKRDSIAAPACISSAISVGATTDSDQIASFSNVADFLDLLAPGSSITSSVPGGGIESWNGTSMAAPHVAGAWAVLKQKAPEMDVTSILEALRETGTQLDDERSGGNVTDMRRINLDQALTILGQPRPEIETSPVAGSLFDFGSVAAGTVTLPLVLQVHNSGDADLNLVCTLGGTSAESFAIESCPAAAAPDSTVEVSFYCQPLAAGEVTASLDLATNDADEAEVNFSLVCNGTDVLFSDGFEGGND
jgi:subtilisin family serine protease